MMQPNDYNLEKNKPSKNKKVMLIGGAILALLIFSSMILLLGSPNSQNKSPNLPTPTQNLNSNANYNNNPAMQLQRIQTALLSFEQETASSANIVLDTGNKAVTAVQIEVSFDPAVLNNVIIKPGTFFERPLVLLNKINYQNGDIFYAVVLPPNTPPKQGKGTIATISYAFNPGTINPTMLRFLPRTKVAGEGVDDSTLKEAKNIVISYNK